MSRYNETSKRYTINYAKENLKRVALDVKKEYYENVLKPAADAAGEPINTYIKKAIEMRMNAEAPRS